MKDFSRLYPEHGQENVATAYHLQYVFGVKLLCWRKFHAFLFQASDSKGTPSERVGWLSVGPVFSMSTSCVAFLALQRCHFFKVILKSRGSTLGFWPLNLRLEKPTSMLQSGWKGHLSSPGTFLIGALNLPFSIPTLSTPPSHILHPPKSSQTHPPLQLPTPFRQLLPKRLHSSSSHTQLRHLYPRRQ